MLLPANFAMPGRQCRFVSAQLRILLNHSQEARTTTRLLPNMMHVDVALVAGPARKPAPKVPIRPRRRTDGAAARLAARGRDRGIQVPGHLQLGFRISGVESSRGMSRKGLCQFGGGGGGAALFVSF